MTPVRCLIVDDERLARVVLVNLAISVPELRVVGEAEDIKGARDAVSRLLPEVVFLDVNLPDGDGFDLLGTAGAPAPWVVFVTAHHQHAVRAFACEALDYLVKPVEPERFAQTVHRILRRLRPAHVRGKGASCASGAGPCPEGAVDPMSIFIQAGATGCFVAPGDILMVQSDRNYSTAYFADGRTLLVRQPLSAWMQRLPPGRFVQIDRTLIINLARVAQAEVRAHAATLHWSGKAAPREVGRSAAVRLRRLLRRG